MEDKQMTVPYIVYEGALDRAERRDKWHISVIVLLITLLVLSNIAWIIVWNQFDYTDDYSVDIQSESGDANYIGIDGDIYNGENNSSQKKDTDPQGWEEEKG